MATKTATTTPKNRLSEVMFMFTQNREAWLSHYDFAMALWQLNSHKRMGELKKLGIEFEERPFVFDNKFGRKSKMKQFRVTSTKEQCLKVYNEINR